MPTLREQRFEGQLADRLETLYFPHDWLKMNLLQRWTMHKYWVWMGLTELDCETWCARISEQVRAMLSS